MSDLPEQYSEDWFRLRPVRIKFRRGEGFDVQAKYEEADGKTVNVSQPFIMESGDEDSHSLYADKPCWTIEDRAPWMPVYLCEGDFEWITP